MFVVVMEGGRQRDTWRAIRPRCSKEGLLAIPCKAQSVMARYENNYNVVWVTRTGLRSSVGEVCARFAGAIELSRSCAASQRHVIRTGAFSTVNSAGEASDRRFVL